MDSQDIRDRIMAAINGIIKDDGDSATSNLHDVLAAKMRARINPEGDAEAEADEETVENDESDIEESEDEEGTTED